MYLLYKNTRKRKREEEEKETIARCESLYFPQISKKDTIRLIQKRNPFSESEVRDKLLTFIMRNRSLERVHLLISGRKINHRVNNQRLLSAPTIRCMHKYVTF